MCCSRPSDLNQQQRYLLLKIPDIYSGYWPLFSQILVCKETFSPHLKDSLIVDLESDSIHRMRLLAKFVEGNYDKVDKILEVRETAKTRTRETEADIEKEKQVFPTTIGLERCSPSQRLS